MQLWAGLFKALPLKPVSLDMPEGAYWTWVDPELKALSHESCEGAQQLPFVEGTEPRSESPCLARIDRDEKKSIWRKWFERN
jgi:penicillin-binding protein 1B